MAKTPWRPPLCDQPSCARPAVWEIMVDEAQDACRHSCQVHLVSLIQTDHSEYHVYIIGDNQ